LLTKKRGFSRRPSAATLARQLLEISGFREYYNPFTGAREFAWSGLLLDMN
jgi:hypothetical protein